MASNLKFSSKQSSVVARYEKGMTAISNGKPGAFDISYAHTALCQTYLPTKDIDSTLYEVRQGALTLRIQGASFRNEEGKQENRGVPSGTRARLLLYLINQKAIMSKEQTFQLATSFRDLCRQLGIATSGRSMNELKVQFERLCTAFFSFEWKGQSERGIHNFTIVKTLIVNVRMKGMKYAKQNSDTKGFWITLSDEYYNSIIRSGVPLDRRAISALQNNSMCLDIYCWLTHRLQYIPKSKSNFVGWQNIKEQFGYGFSEMHNFKRDFRKNLQNVKLQYPRAKISEVPNRGFTLYRSEPPVGEKIELLG